MLANGSDGTASFSGATHLPYLLSVHRLSHKTLSHTCRSTVPVKFLCTRMQFVTLTEVLLLKTKIKKCVSLQPVTYKYCEAAKKNLLPWKLKTFFLQGLYFTFSWKEGFVCLFYRKPFCKKTKTAQQQKTIPTARRKLVWQKSNCHFKSDFAVIKYPVLWET